MSDVEKAFLSYTGPYRAYGEKVILKIDHTLRVRKLCEEIADSLGMDQESYKVAEACGLLHDIGRFEQWRRYRTYNDLNSVDHGDLGRDLLEENQLMDSFSRPQQEILLDAVEFHNKYRVPETLPDRSRRFVNLTRDADKLDILELYATGKLGQRTDGTAMSPETVRILMERRPVSRQDIRTKADRIAICLGFVFDLNYHRSFEILKERNLIQRFILLQIKEAENPELVGQLEKLGNTLF